MSESDIIVALRPFGFGRKVGSPRLVSNEMDVQVRTRLRITYPDSKSIELC